MKRLLLSLCFGFTLAACSVPGLRRDPAAPPALDFISRLLLLPAGAPLTAAQVVELSGSPSL